MLSFGIRIIGLLDLGRVLRCYVVHLGKIQILLFSKKNDLKGADVACWEGIILRSGVSICGTDPPLSHAYGGSVRR